MKIETAIVTNDILKGNEFEVVVVVSWDGLAEESVEELAEESVEELSEESVEELTEESVDEESVEELSEGSVEELVTVVDVPVVGSSVIADVNSVSVVGVVFVLIVSLNTPLLFLSIVYPLVSRANTKIAKNLIFFTSSISIYSHPV